MKLGKQHALVLAVAATLPLTAQAAPQLYGQINVSADVVDNGSNSRGYIESNSSRLGVMGSQPVADGVNAKYVLEFGYEADQQGTGNGGASTGRDRYVALETAYGALRAGAFSTPIKNVQGSVDRFNDLNVADMASAPFAKSASLGIGRDDRYSNAVGYTSPTYMGLAADVVFAPDENAAAQNDKVSANITYNNQGVYGGIGYEHNAGEDAYRLAANYVMGAAEVGVLAQNDKIAGAGQSVDSVLVSGQYTMGKCVYKAQIGQLDDGSADKRNVITAGMDHNYNSNVTAYGLISYAEQGSADATAISAGVKYQF